jgi:pimeloyl-ACP methyl ester carboxylesterase
MPKRPLLLIHGYSDLGRSFERWRDVFVARGHETTTIHLAQYVTLSNEITIKDIAEGFDRALAIRAKLAPGDPFDAVVHSTGMLVVREWLTAYPERAARLKHLIGLAPATFGSPNAHKGRSWLGAIFKGNKQPGPDFLEAGDRVLTALELGSPYLWSLAHKDLVAEVAMYGPTTRTPYPFVFMGLHSYTGIRRAVNEPGTDGTIRWAGAGFNARKIAIDLTVDPARKVAKRVTVRRWRNVDVPLIFLDQLNHSTILRDPSDTLIAMVAQALQVESRAEYDAWRAKYSPASQRALKARKARHWQQFVVHAIDERDDPIDDYFIELGTIDKGEFTPITNFDLDVHAFTDDRSYRCFHVDLNALREVAQSDLGMRIIASSGTDLVGYTGVQPDTIPLGRVGDETKWDAAVDLSTALERADLDFFYPFTTTLVEIRLNREPLPLVGESRVFKFLP